MMMNFLLLSLAFVSLCYCASIKRQKINSFGSEKEQSPDMYNGRIVGGRTVDIFMHPYQISLRMKGWENNIYVHNCGGSIISSTLIVTAAHCVFGQLATHLHVVAGGNQRTSSDDVVAPVQKFVTHRGFDSISLTNDIALVKLATPLPLNNFTIRAIELADEEAKEEQIATVSGWGDTGAGIYADFLQEVKVPIVSNELCNEKYNPTDFISDDMMCAACLGKDSCEGDSGGPLVINRKLAGVVSWGIDCASPQKPGVYSRISYFRPWLLKQIAKYE